ETLFSEELAITQSSTSSIFSRPGEYFAIQLDNNNVPHIAWSDARSNQMDIYYSHGLIYIPFRFSVELIIIITIIMIIGFTALIMIFYIRYKRNIHKKSKRKLAQRTKDYTKTFRYICSNCHEFANTLREYCESCGAKDTLKRATREDYHNYLPDLN
ncbi:MAG: hypothetical protein ACFFBY_14490, partial [Promethearchaeota archaeon]